MKKIYVQMGIYLLGCLIVAITMPILFAMAFYLSSALVLVLMPKFIQYLKKVSIQQTESEYALEKKTGTPIMGGLLFNLVVVVVTLVFSVGKKDLTLWMLILGVIGFGMIGFVDDMTIVLKRNNVGLKARTRLAIEAVLALVMILLLSCLNGLDYLKGSSWIGYLFFLSITLLMFMGSTNAVNLTDGMDGLAGGVSLIAFLAYFIYAVQKQLPVIAIFCAAMMGALFGYLFFNHKPAKVFMGDTGSLALGGSLATIAFITHTEWAFILIAGIPVLEALSVMIQIGSVKLCHRRVFPYTPIHYSFKIWGLKEVQVVYLFWLLEFMFAMMGLWLLIH
ncbi:phospho-N-acetylmuramoyl-pentapeptide-transferase [Bulleidia extructa W1219]|uniref:Phospho-N-acetylmuramoyl-pentapeptide-transferase n=1 Tax=Bulleidia extructa W1219 TaxID=679192 RepID=D2MQP1_9FIRM|nr:phospho-N-acetylmuramoyl-pentapeptide-transferase [Bulleidia extructa]EFC05310.1 phospho-N-acetylmuramoyl-pentapeptide-transferase [Bulleidia extructa W1219]